MVSQNGEIYLKELSQLTQKTVHLNLQKTANIPGVNILKSSVPVMKNSVNIADENISEKNETLFRKEPLTWESGESFHYLGNDTEASEEDYNSTA